MKKRTLLFPLLAGLLLVGLLLVISFRNQASHRQHAGTSSVAIDPKMPRSQINVEERELRDDMRKALKATEDEWTRMLESPINFYGKVVDQDDQPVVGIEIHCGWSLMTSMDGLIIKSTAPDGLFEVTGRKGMDMSFSVYPPKGYRITETSIQKFTFADYSERLRQAHNAMGKPLEAKHKPDKSSPVIFRIKKVGPADMLHKANQGGDLIPLDGSPRYYSLSKPSAKGLIKPRPHSIEIQLVSEMKLEERLTGPRSWSMKIRVPGGGLQIIEPNKNTTASDYDELFAPIDGYQEELFFDFPKNMSNFRSAFTKEFFFRFSDNSYGRATVMGGWYDVRIESLYNPTGSRNLLLDETKIVELKKTP